MNCKHCGNELMAGAKFCNKCGQKVEIEEDYIPSDIEAVNSLSKQEEGKQKTKESKMLKIIKAYKYYILAGLAVIVIIAILIPKPDKGNKAVQNDNPVIATGSSIISSALSSGLASETQEEETSSYTGSSDYDNNESSSISDEDDYSDEEKESDMDTTRASDEGVSYEDEEETTEEPVATYQNSIIEVYKGRGNEKTYYAYNQNLIRSFEDKLAEITGAEDDGSLGMRYEIIELLGKNHDYFLDYYYNRYRPTEKDVSPFVNTVRSYLGGWGVDTAPTTVYTESLRQEHNGYTYDFSGTDAWGNDIKVHTYFELIEEDTVLSRILVWTEDVDNIEE